MEREYRESEVREHYHELTRFLISRGLSITTMESATSGQIASLITDTEGSSAIFKGAFITYSNEAKIMMGVPERIIDRFTVYSEETAAAMAQVCRQRYSADIGIGVTGTMGNADPANPDASVPGKVFFAVDLKDRGVSTKRLSLVPQPSRLMYKLAVAEEIFQALAGLLK